MVSITNPTEGRNIDGVRNCTLSGDDGRSIMFGNLLDQQPETVTRTLIIFIRHFFCGNCQEYVRRLSTDLAPSTLPKDLSIVIIGCGAPSLIASYMQITQCPYPIYADPSIRLYKLLGMQRSLSLGSKGPAYIQHSLASGMVKSIVQGLKRIPAGDVMQAGNLDINGGEFLLKRNLVSSSGSGLVSQWQISWSHCMMNSRDHAEIEDVRRALELKYPSPGMPKDMTRPQLAKQSSSGSLRRSLSLRRTTWMGKSGHATRSTSLKQSIVEAV